MPGQNMIGGDRLDGFLMNARRQWIVPAFLEFVVQAYGQRLSLFVVGQREQGGLLRGRELAGIKPHDGPVADSHGRLLAAEAIDAEHAPGFLRRASIASAARSL